VLRRVDRYIVPDVSEECSAIIFRAFLDCLILTMKVLRAIETSVTTQKTGIFGDKRILAMFLHYCLRCGGFYCPDIR